MQNLPSGTNAARADEYAIEQAMLRRRKRRRLEVERLNFGNGIDHETGVLNMAECLDGLKSKEVHYSVAQPCESWFNGSHVGRLLDRRTDC